MGDEGGAGGVRRPISPRQEGRKLGASPELREIDRENSPHVPRAARLSFRFAASDASTRQPRPVDASAHTPPTASFSRPHHVSAIRPETLSKNYEVSCRSRRGRFHGPGAIANTSSRASLPAGRHGRSRLRRSRTRGWYKAAARPSACRPVRPGLATTRKLLRCCQMGVSSASTSVLLRAESAPLRIAFVPDRRTARDCIGDVAAMPRRYAA